MINKRIERIRFVIVWIGVAVLLFSGCGKEQPVKQELPQTEFDGRNAGFSVIDAGLLMQETEKQKSTDIEADRAADDRENTEEEKNIDRAEEKETDRREAYRGRYQRLFRKEDFVSEEIACANVFAAYQDGRENPEILRLYEEEGETWEYLFYAAYDFNNDKRMDYAVVRGNFDDNGAQEGFCGADLWFLSSDGDYERAELPKAVYLTGGTWQEPELFMMTLVYCFAGERAIGVYHDYEKERIALYGLCWHSRAGYQYERVRAVTITEEVSDTTLIHTEFQVGGQALGLGEWVVKVEFLGKEGNPDFYQMLLVDNVIPTAGEEASMAWDGNDDGYEDILYYAGSGGGSGGGWKAYKLFIWSEREEMYLDTSLPDCISIDYEAHKIYHRWRNGASYEWYDIYGLRDGEYQLEQEIILDELPSEDGGRILVAQYYEWGELVEEYVNVDTDWEEMERFLQEKYPLFNFWTKG
ncbi:MAG: hypothetical protein HDQ98_16325 [Lachnospiraceae bacterium]|nr:hypothetical protein [Lachnospiraceae bacterium]